MKISTGAKAFGYRCWLFRLCSIRLLCSSRRNRRFSSVFGYGRRRSPFVRRRKMILKDRDGSVDRRKESGM